MPYTGRSVADIRDSILADWSTAYTQLGRSLLIVEGSPAYLWASALAIQLQGVEAQAEQVARDILPDEASDASLLRWGAVYAVERRPATAAEITVTVTAAIDGAYSIPAGSLLVYSDGTSYAVEDTTVTITGGTGTVSATAVLAGTAGTREVGDTLTWSVAPAGLDPTGTVASLVTPGAAEESFPDYAQRIVEKLQERPASGNRADWRDWVEAYQGLAITDAYVYPLLAPPAVYPGAGTQNTLGTVTVVAVGPAQGSSTTNSRALGTPGQLLTGVVDYIEGDRTVMGVATTTGTQLRPVTMAPTDYSIEAISTVAQNVSITVMNAAAYSAGWASPIVTAAGSTTTSLVTVGDNTALTGKAALIPVSTSAARGGIQAFTFGNGVFGGVNTVFTQTGDNTLLTAPGAGVTIRPAPTNTTQIIEAIFAYFDALGPGDTQPVPTRWPDEATKGPATLYQSALSAAVQAVPGVLSVGVTTPAADVLPAAKEVVTLDVLTIIA